MKSTCPDCLGTGLDSHHKWFDGTQPYCETCEGNGIVEGLPADQAEDERLDDPRRGQAEGINRLRYEPGK
jgi:hypothetical protein